MSNFNFSPKISVLILFIVFSSSFVVVAVEKLVPPYNYWRVDNHTETDNRPHLGMTYLHMRKSGGTEFLLFLRRWMESHQCLGSDVKNHWTLFKGVQNGNIIGYSVNSSNCTSFDLKHIEFSCLNLKSTLELPPFHSRPSSLHFSLFTILRHPIDRIGAQAFYGNTIGDITLQNLIFQNCFPTTHGPNFNPIREFDKCSHDQRTSFWLVCECYYRSFNQTIHLLQTNETLWYEWFHQSTYGDGYKSNYYLKRMVYGSYSTSLSSSLAHQHALNCLLNSSIDCPGIPLLNLLTPSSACDRGGNQNLTQMRIEVEYLLRTHYDFLILEEFSHPLTPYLLGTILNERNISLIEQLLKSSKSANAGLLSMIPAKYKPPPSSSGLKYSFVFPPAVLKFLMDDNREDIALYEYAVRLFRQRVAHVGQLFNFSHHERSDGHVKGEQKKDNEDK